MAVFAAVVGAPADFMMPLGATEEAAGEGTAVDETAGVAIVAYLLM
jgi:hypothetical protein